MLHSPCPGKGLVLTFRTTPLNVIIFFLINSCILAFIAKQVSKKYPTAPSWYLHVAFALSYGKYSAGSESIALGVTNEF